jgi:hypothetical protein
MGYFKDEHIILTCAAREPLEQMWEKIIDNIIEAFEDDPDQPDYSNYIPKPTNDLMNGGSTLFIPADGSKEGWTVSNAMDEVREKLRADIIKHNTKSTDKIGMYQMTRDDFHGVSGEQIIEQW